MTVWQALGIDERPQQAKLLEFWNQRDGKEPVLVEAGTGTGKSFPLIIEALKKARLSKRPVVISSGTNALVDQYYTRDVPRVVDAMNCLLEEGDKPYAFAMIKGRRNYVCLSRMRDAAGSGLIPSDVVRLIEAEAEKVDGVLSQMPLINVNEELIVAPQKEDCMCDGACYYNFAKAKMAKADLIITNHKYIALDAFLDMTTEGNVQLLPEYMYLFLDEIHTFEPYVRDTLGFHILKGSCGKAFKKSGGKASQERIDEYSARLFAMLPNMRDKDRERALELNELKDIRVPLQHLWDAMNREVKELLKNTLDGQDYNDMQYKLTPVYNRMDQLTTLKAICADDESLAYNDLATWDGGRITVRPVRIDEFCAEAIWPRCSLLGVSATIPDSLPDRIGIPDTIVRNVGSPFDYGDQACLWISDSGKKRSDFWRDQEGLNGWLKERCREIYKLIVAANGGALLLFTSYADLDDHLGILEQPLKDKGYTVLRQGATGADNMRIGQEFKDDKDSILFGVDTFGTGFDAPGSACRLVIIANVPWGVPNDPLKLKMEQVPEWGSKYYMDEMLLKLAQWSGRLIRTQEDRGVVAILNKGASRFVRSERVLIHLKEMDRVDYDEALDFLRANR